MIKFIKNILADLIYGRGVTLIKKDGTEHNRILGKLIPRAAIVIVNDGINFVYTGERTDYGFVIYMQGYGTYEYRSNGN